MTDEDYMQLALAEAREAAREDEVPVGAVIVCDGKVLTTAHNMTRQARMVTRHAEMIAIERASDMLNNERLTECDIYITKEPCAMCAGAIVHARFRRVIIGARDSRFGACGTVLSVCGNVALNHLPGLSFGVCESEAVELLRSFFRERR